MDHSYFARDEKEGNENLVRGLMNAFNSHNAERLLDF
jgi:hypothetical protein